MKNRAIVCRHIGRREGRAPTRICPSLAGIRQGAAATTETERASISVKLSTLHARRHPQADRVWAGTAAPSILRVAKECHIAVSALDMRRPTGWSWSWNCTRDLLSDPRLPGSTGLALCCEAYQKRAIHVARALSHMARELNRAFRCAR